MVNFIQTNPGVIASIISLLLIIVAYLWKKGENGASKMLAEKLDDIGKKLDKLFAYNDSRAEDIGDLKARMSRQEQRCDDRYHDCPGRNALNILDRRQDRQLQDVEKLRNE